MKNKINQFQSFYAEKDFWNKVQHYAKVIGIPVLYASLLLYFAFREKETPAWAKHIVTGALGYLISPIDALPDLTPILGYTDDMGVLSFALVTIACYITGGVKDKAREKLSQWFGEVQPDMLRPVEKHAKI